jgi:hypothetical protein
MISAEWARIGRELRNCKKDANARADIERFFGGPLAGLEMKKFGGIWYAVKVSPSGVPKVGKS